MPFDRWNDRIEAAQDLDSRRALVREVLIWRARNLADTPAQRDAAYALVRLHQTLGDEDSARKEAHGLLSLCQTPPEASAEDTRTATGLLRNFGVRGVVAAPTRPPRRAEGRPESSERPDRGERPERAERPDRGERPERPERARAERPARPERMDRIERPERPASPLDEAIAAATAERWDDAARALEGREDPRSELVRTYAVLARALRDDDEFRRARGLVELEHRLRERALAPRRDARAEIRTDARTDGRPDARAPREDLGHPEGRGEGRPVDARQARIDALEAALAADPSHADAIAARALAEHLTAEGPRAPAPWLIGAVARALVSGSAPKTRAEIERQTDLGTFAVTAYSEAPFASLVDALREAPAAGLSYVALRRGVLSRGEPRDRKLWTLRLARDGAECLLVVGASNADDPYRADTAERLADRVAELSDRALLVAPGPGNAPLREAAAARGIPATEELSGAVSKLAALEPSARAPRAPRSEEPRESREPREPRERGEARPPRLGPDFQKLQALLSGPEAPQVEDLATILRALPRVYRGFAVAKDALAALDPAEADRRLATLLAAADQAAPERSHLSEGTTLAIRSSAAVDRSEAVALLSSGPTAARYGGPGADLAARLGVAMIKAGWDLDRVLRGSTGRERKEDPALDALGDHADGLWRLVVERAGVSGEVWAISGMSPEAKATALRLLAAPGRRAVVIPVDDPALSWYSGLGGPGAVGWTGDESAADVIAALSEWKD